MNTMKCGINSKSSEVVEWTVKLLSKMATDFDSFGLQQEAWEWVNSGEISMLTTIFETIAKHPCLFKEIAQLIMEYSKTHFDEVFKEKIKEIYKEEVQYWEQLTSFLPFFLDTQQYKEDFKDFFEQKIQEITRDFSTYEDENLKSTAVTFIVELWIDYPEIVTNEVSADIVSMLTELAKSPQSAIKYSTVTHMFKLLDICSSQKQSQAPIIYKALIFTLVDSHYDDTTRAYMMSNFMNFFESSESIPVGILLDPLIKQFMESEGSTYKYNTFDFEFFISIVKHPKFRLNDAIPLMDALAKIYLNDTVFCYAASVPFMMIVHRFVDTPILMSYVKKFITLALSILLSSSAPTPESQQITRQRKPLPLPPSRSKKSAQGNKPVTKKGLDSKLKMISIIEICK